MAKVSFLIFDYALDGERKNVQTLIREKKSYNHLLKKNVERSIYLKFIFTRVQQFRVKLDEQIQPVFWDFNRQRVKQQYHTAFDVNLRLDKLKNDVLVHYRTLKENGSTFEIIKDSIIQMVRQQDLPKVSDNNKKNLLEAFDFYIQYQLNTNSVETARTRKTLRGAFVGFAEKTGHDFGFDDINVTFHDDFVNFLRVDFINRSDGLPGLAASTINKLMKIFKQFGKWSFARDYHSNSIFNSQLFKGTAVRIFSENERPNNIALTLDEIHRLQNLKFESSNALEKIRDLFLFQTATGIRISDLMNFDKSTVDKKQKLWRFKALKNGKNIVMPLVFFEGMAWRILEKYNFDLPKFSNQVYNRKLKKICEIAVIDSIQKITKIRAGQKQVFEFKKFEMVSSHTARRSFATILLNDFKLPISIVSRLVGDSVQTLIRHYDKTGELQILDALKDINLLG